MTTMTKPTTFLPTDPPAPRAARRWLPARAQRALALWGLLWLPLWAQAQFVAAPPTSASDRALLAQMARDWIEPALQNAVAETAGGILRPEVVMGELDSRLRLTPCPRVEPYLPAGTRLWGRARVGLRCTEGAVRWNVFVPVTVKAWGPAWVLRRPVPAGTELVQEDAELVEVDWAERSASVLATPEGWVGQQAAFALAPGQTLRENMVRPVPAFNRGAQVKVKSIGAGFHVVVSGEAMGVGVVGQSVRVKLGGGRIVTGTVREGAMVEVQL
jgi:flagella basal body P-ring formation protein FlgA